jgi:4-amino-4-deoxy-L-arabinose transferase-like glycosyltransferase
MTLIVAGFIGREVFRDRRLENAVPLVMVGVPMFTAMSAAVSNDPLANLVAAGLTLACLRAVRRFPRRGTAAGLGVLLAIGLWTKLSLAVFVPIVVASVLFGGWRTASLRQGLRAVATAVGVAFILYAPWLVRQGLTYGWNDLFASRRHDQVVLDQPRFPGFTTDHVGYLAQTTFHSFWAQFGWMGLPVEDRLYWLWGILSVLAAVGLTRLAPARRFLRGGANEHAALSIQHSSDSALSTRHSAPRVERVAVLTLVVCGYLAALAYYNLTFIQAQGRYLFPALPALAALAILGWTYLLPRGVGPLAALAIGLGLVALNGYTFLRFLLPAFAR